MMELKYCNRKLTTLLIIHGMKHFANAIKVEFLFEQSTNIIRELNEKCMPNRF